MVVFVAGSWMPFWLYMKLPEGSFCGTGAHHQTSLWIWLTVRDEPDYIVNRYYDSNLRNLAGLSAVSLAIGFGVYWRRTREFVPDQATDYADGPTGVTTDGRMVHYA
jgi:hypothetical protein